MAVAWLTRRSIETWSIAQTSSKAGIKVIQAAQGSESAIQTERISHSSTYDPPMRLCVNTRRTGGKRSERARHAASEDHLRVARLRLGTLLRMNYDLFSFRFRLRLLRGGGRCPENRGQPRARGSVSRGSKET